MKRLLVSTLVFVLTGLPVFAQKEQEERLKNCGEVFREISNIPDNIPENLLQKSVCVLVIPSVKKAAFVVGGSYGRGAITCRTGEKLDGPWSAPAMYRLIEGNVGFQIGAEATDFVLLVMNEGGAKAILKGKAKLGADASAAIGPVGRTASAQTGETMTSEVLSYSRSRGIFAGISLAGANLQADEGDNEALYGRKLTAMEIVREGKVPPPAAAQGFLSSLTTRSTTRDK
jgi:lipid-binding SYLF domain-containing protein